MPTESGPRFQKMKYESDAYQNHEDRIQCLADRANDLGMIRADFWERVVGETGIICSQSDRRPSVAGWFFGHALRLVQHEVRHRQTGVMRADYVQKRKLLQEVLATRLSAMEKNQATPEAQLQIVDWYAEGIDALEKHCAKANIRSLLPNLFLPTRFADRLAYVEYAIDGTDARESLYRRLAELFSSHVDYLAAICDVLAQQGQWKEIVRCIHAAAGIRSESLEQYLAPREGLATAHATAVQHLQDTRPLTP